jgi:hypothetical protein
VESLSSWLERTARLYRMNVKNLLIDAVGPDSSLLMWELDSNPPDTVLSALAERSGLDLARLRAMTLAGWMPWLLDKTWARSDDPQQIFDTYVRQNSVLLAPGEAGQDRFTNERGRHGGGLWFPTRPAATKACPACFLDPDQGKALTWKLAIMAGCGEHGCHLVPARRVAQAARAGAPIQPVPVEEPVATLDRYTYEAFTTGRVVLPGRSVHAGVWFRMLRSLLDEVSLYLWECSESARVILKPIWEAAGQPPRGAMTFWQPYERLDGTTQLAMLHAAGAAVRMAADETIIPRGVHGSALRPIPSTDIYDGDRSSHATPRQETVAELNATLDRAYTDPVAARHLLALLTADCQTLDRFEEQRSRLFGAGIPAVFLPTVRELGRTDLA